MEAQQEYLKRFVRRPDFVTQFLPCISPADFIDRLTSNTSNPLQLGVGGSLSPQERDQLVAELTIGGNTADARASALRKIIENAVYRRRQFNKAFVLMQYFGYLRRAPDQGGYDFWLSKLNQFNGNFIQAEMVKAFITSLEYRARFGAP